MLLLLGCTDEPDPADPSPTSGEVRVLSYNVHGFPSAITGDDTTARLTTLAPLLNDFDVVGLQEVWDPEEAIAPLDAAVELELVAEWTEPVDESRVYGTGLRAYATGAAAEAAGAWYSTCYGTVDHANDCLASKGWVRARLTLAEGVSLDVWNTHLEAGNDPLDDEARAAQVEELLAAIHDTSGDTAMVLTGDFNLASDDPEDVPLLDAITASGLSDACLLVDCPEPTRIDHVYVRDGADVSLDVSAWEIDARFVDAQGNPLSDHDPVAVTVTWG